MSRVHSIVGRRRCCLTVAGELDEATTAPFITVSCLRLSQPDVDHLIIDMSGVTFIGAAGVNALVAIHNLAHTVDKTVVLLNPSQRTVRVLDLTAMIDAFVITSDCQAGL